MTGFTIHERLLASGAEIGMHGICHVLFKNEMQFPWLILVPEVASEQEDLHELSEQDFSSVCRSIRAVSEWLETQFTVEKLNVACIGNQVRQMHIHIVGRRVDDAAWSGVVWSHKEKMPYPENDWRVLLENMKGEFSKLH